MTGNEPPDRGWEHFPHDADVGIRGWGLTREAAFEEAAKAMTAAITAEPVLPVTTVAVQCAAPDPELLLVAWLNALVYEMASRRMLFGDFSVWIAEGALTGEARGEPIDVTRHRPAVEVKGATFTALSVARGADGLWRAQCVIDV